MASPPDDLCTIPSLPSFAFVLCQPTYYSLSPALSHLHLTFIHRSPCLGSMGSQREDLSGPKTRWPVLVDILLSSLHHLAPHPLHLSIPLQTRVVSHLCPCHGNVVWSGSTSKEILWVMIRSQSRIWPRLLSTPWSTQ
jgi:hypothetical protein